MPEPPTFSEAAADVVDSVQGLVEDQVALSVARSTRQARTFAGPALLGLGAGGTAIAGSLFVLVGLTLGLATQLPLWVASAIVGVGLLGGATVLATGSVWLFRRAAEQASDRERDFER